MPSCLRAVAHFFRLCASASLREPNPFNLLRNTAAILLLALAATACHRAPDAVTFHATDNPENLADWGVFTMSNGRLAPRAGLVTYELATPLFSDYAQKWRTVFVPKGASATYDPTGPFDFPVGSIITKTFYFSVPAAADRPGETAEVLKVTPATYQNGVTGLDLAHVRLIETRLLVRRADGWVGLPYVWNADQTKATLQRAGADVSLTLLDDGKRTNFVYSVPNANQCAGCHTLDHRTRAVEPIGLQARHLNRTFPGAGGEINQLKRLAALGYLTGVPTAGIPRDADWSDAAAPLDARARAYLDINCAHCHSPTGPARVSGLWLDSANADPRALGVCKPPVAAGNGAEGRAFDIVPGDAPGSVLSHRMAITDPGARMPETGRSLTHAEGVALIDAWIDQLKGECRVADAPKFAMR
ncbi:putative repeat protein (TIGR03806 family) [Hephaestia caeni]|uniref:Putative repeat protein (TIGR03806 family) n=1 Tax=Hephaestia caeni TaxID=645617 RepID=A0A397P7C6_9SPHN|nr:SO2930 family diheme c-type cytochrome [Hephaestia caeni]RIA44233.1 putative repeat protein (TIGR03806 family) [Hephaestia caeni]